MNLHFSHLKLESTCWIYMSYLDENNICVSNTKSKCMIITYFVAWCTWSVSSAIALNKRTNYILCFHGQIEWDTDTRLKLVADTNPTKKLLIGNLIYLLCHASNHHKVVFIKLISLHFCQKPQHDHRVI